MRRRSDWAATATPVVERAAGPVRRARREPAASPAGHDDVRHDVPASRADALPLGGCGRLSTSRPCGAGRSSRPTASGGTFAMKCCRGRRGCDRARRTCDVVGARVGRQLLADRGPPDGDDERRRCERRDARGAQAAKSPRRGGRAGCTRRRRCQGRRALPRWCDRAFDSSLARQRGRSLEEAHPSAGGCGRSARRHRRRLSSRGRLEEVSIQHEPAVADSRPRTPASCEFSQCTTIRDNAPERR